MSWTVILEDENREPITMLSDELDNSLSNFKSKFKILCFLDPYGDTIFNNLQMNVLIEDLQSLNLIIEDPLFDEITLLAERCRDDEHTYLVFYGD